MLAIAFVPTGPSRLFPVESPAAALPAIDRVDPDRADVEAAARGDLRAFESLYRRHSARIHGVLRRLSGRDASRAEEWTQESFVQAWQRLDSFRGDSAFGTWLHRLAVNVALMSLRSSRRSDAATVEWDADTFDLADGSSAGHDLRIDLAEAVARLPARARAVLVLHDVEGWKHEEIGKELGVAVGTSKAQLHRARALLRGFLEKNP